MSDPDSNEWICSTLLRRTDPAITTRGLAEKDKVWKTGQELSIGFLGGSRKLQDRVLDTATRWTTPQEGGANLSFVRSKNTDSADIRISFDAAGGSWSMVGLDARTVPQNEATMNLGWATEITPEKAFASVVLHEFGHALGLLHEHNHPEVELRWKKHVVYSELGSPPNNWSTEDVDFNVFNQYPKDRVVLTDKPDLVSIMIYAIPARWLDGQKAITPSDHLSKGDVTFIRDLYP